MRHLAWLNTMPDKREGEVEARTRREAYGSDVTMPECDAEYIVAYLLEVGVVEGEHALSFQEIESWQRQTGIELHPWEVRFVKRLSEAYVGQARLSRNPDAKAPWGDAPYVRAAAIKRHLAYFSGM